MRILLCAARRQDTMTLATKMTTAGLAALLSSAMLVAAAWADTGLISTCTPAPPAADPALPSASPAVVVYPTPSSTAITKTSAVLQASVDTMGSQARSRSSSVTRQSGVRCTAVRSLPAIVGPQVVTAQLRSEKPGTTIRFRVVVTTAAGQVVGGDQTFTTVAPIARLAPGTTMLGVRVGYLTPAAAQARVAGPLRTSARVHVPRQAVEGNAEAARRARRRRRAPSPGRCGCGRGRSIPVAVTVDSAKVAHYVAYLDRSFSRAARSTGA